MAEEVKTPSKTRSRYNKADSEIMIKGIMDMYRIKTEQIKRNLQSTYDLRVQSVDDHINSIKRIVPETMLMGEFEEFYGCDLARYCDGNARDKVMQGQENADRALEQAVKKKRADTAHTLATSDSDMSLKESKASKSARKVLSPKKAVGPPTPRRTTRNSAMTASKTNAAFNTRSPQKLGRQVDDSPVPTASTFRPRIPITPGFPRKPGKSERLMSINGSPLEIEALGNLNLGGENVIQVKTKSGALIKFDALAVSPGTLGASDLSNSTRKRTVAKVLDLRESHNAKLRDMLG